MRRWIKVALWAIAILVGVPILLVALLVVAINTAPGRHEVEALIPKLTKGEVQIAGLSGALPEHLRLGGIELRDQNGAWLTVNDLALDWSPLALVVGKAEIQRLSAAQAVLSRFPSAQPSSKPQSGLRLPLRVALRDFHIDRFDLLPPTMSPAATVSLHGRATLNSLSNGDGAFTIARLDAPGSYRLSATVNSSSIEVQVSGSEPAQGLIASLAHLPNLGPLSVSANLQGPRDAERANLNLAAGPLRAAGHGTLDLVGKKANLDLDAEAPAMTPGPGLAWQSARFDAHLHGAFDRPDAEATMDIRNIVAGNFHFGDIAANVTGQGGKLHGKAEIAGFQVDGQASPFMTAPLELTADVILNQPTRPLTFRLSHPLIAMDGHADLGGNINAAVSMKVLNLAPFASIGRLNLQGSASATATAVRTGATTHIAADGRIDLTGGQPIAVRAGGNTKFSFAADLAGQDVSIEHAAIDAQALNASLTGSRKNGILDADLTLAVSDLSAVQPPLTGTLKLDASLKGPVDALALSAKIDGEVGAPGVPRGPLTASVSAQGLPQATSGKLDARGTLLGAPLALAAGYERNSAGMMTLAVTEASWKSLRANGNISVAQGSSLPTGQFDLAMARLGDLAPFVRMPVGGDLHASFKTVTATGGQPQAIVKLDANHFAFGEDRIDRISLNGRVDELSARPAIDARMDLSGLAVKGASGSARLDVSGPENALSLRLSSDLDISGRPARIAAKGTVDVPQHSVRLAAFEGSYAGETARLLEPLGVTYGKEVTVEHLRLGIDKAVITANGRVSPSLDFTLAVRNASPALAAPFLPPSLAADGTIALQAKLAGTAASPQGTIRLTASQIQLRSGTGYGLPPARLEASANLMNHSARVDARLVMGDKASLRLDGTAPIAKDAPIDLKTSGFLSLTVANPVLTPAGRSVQGKLLLNLTINGTSAAPRITGGATLTGGAVEDFAQGVHLTDINGRIEARGDALNLHVTGLAGPGHWTISGTATPTSPGIPVDLKLVATDARPLASNFITADLDADLTISGQATSRVAIAGITTINRASINIPDSLPGSVATLNVVRPGQKPQPPSQPPLIVALDVTVKAPGEIFVRGHGLDAVMAGKLTVAGTSANPQISGGFDLRRGTFSLAGQTLDFTQGRVSFNGTSPSGKLDPTLDFVATSTAGDIVATLAVTGYADAPKISLTSTPPLPQDEILAHLLFGESTKQLSPFQMAEILGAIGSLSGVTPGGISNPLAAVRKGLGLDRLTVGSATNSSGTAIQAGKYVTNGIYVGTKQNISGGTQAQVQIDLTKHLKLDTQLGTGGGAPATGATPENDPGSSVGLSYQLHY